MSYSGLWPACLPGSPGRALGEQLVKSAGSIGANIAEGFNRSQRQFVNSLDIALGEANEAENWLYKARDTALLKPDVATQHIKTIIEIERMLSVLKREIASNRDAVREQSAPYGISRDGEQGFPPLTDNRQPTTDN